MKNPKPDSEQGSFRRGGTPRPVHAIHPRGGLWTGFVWVDGGFHGGEGDDMGGVSPVKISD